MDDKKVEEVLRIVDPKRRDFLKKLVVGTAFTVPIVASYSVKELGAQVIGSPGTTTAPPVISTASAVTTPPFTGTAVTTVPFMTVTTTTETF